jgi:predicted transcriptional regulator
VDDTRKPAPASWLEALATSDAELAAGLTVPGEKVLQELDDSIRRLESEQKSRRPPLGEMRSSHVDSQVTANAQRELDIIEGIQRGLADFEAGNVVSHDEAMAEIYGVIDASARHRKV